MRNLATLVIAAWTLSAISLFSAAEAQQLAPGPALPSVTGGIGAGSTPIAPGPAGGGLIQYEGPGNVPLAIGPAIPSQPSPEQNATPNRVPEAGAGHCRPQDVGGIGRRVFPTSASFKRDRKSETSDLRASPAMTR
jgi:hypothetical protein